MVPPRKSLEDYEDDDFEVIEKRYRNDSGDVVSRKALVCKYCMKEMNAETNVRARKYEHINSKSHENMVTKITSGQQPSVSEALFKSKKRTDEAHNAQEELARALLYDGITESGKTRLICSIYSCLVCSSWRLIQYVQEFA